MNSIRTATMIQTLQDACPVPAWPRRLGAGGALPFILLPVVVLFDPVRADFWQYAALAYGAVILSFVGALHWAFAMLLPGDGESQRNRHFAWSTVPALLGWLALLLPHAAGIGLIVAGLCFHYLRDRKLAIDSASGAVLPAWYLPLRLSLTTAATLGLLGMLLVRSMP